MSKEIDIQQLREHLKGKNPIQFVIEGLQALQQVCNIALEENQSLALRCNSTLGTLANQLAHAAGVNIGAATALAAEKKPTHILGIPIATPPAPVKQEAITPSEEEKSQLQELTDQAFNDFLTLEPGVLKETYGDLIIRAVAVKAGLDVTPTNPEKVNVAFVREVIAAVKNKTEETTQVSEADKAAATASAGAAPVKQGEAANNEPNTNPDADATTV